MTKQILRFTPGARGVHSPSWVGLRDFFGPTQKFGLVRLVTQPNLQCLGWVGVVPIFFFFFFYVDNYIFAWIMTLLSLKL